MEERRFCENGPANGADNTGVARDSGCTRAPAEALNVSADSFDRLALAVKKGSDLPMR